jgi:exopolysaccharide biosynthesis polyprenyl glycosylphosphotransferase
VRKPQFSGRSHAFWTLIAQIVTWNIAAIPALLTARIPLAIAAGWTTGLISTCWVLVAADRRDRTTPSRTDDVSLAAKAMTVGSAGWALAATLAGGSVRLFFIALFWILGFVGLLVVRGIIRQLWRSADNRRVVVIGAGQDAVEVVGLLRDHPEGNLQFSGVLGDMKTAERNGMGSYWLGPVDDLRTILAENKIEAAVVTTNGFRSTQFREILAGLRSAEVEAMLSTGVSHLDAASLRFQSVVNEPLISLRWNPPTRLYLAVKRMLDVVGSSLGLLLSLPLLVLIAIAIKLDDRGPVFYSSPRVGTGHEPFGMLKFRSMRVDAHLDRNDLAQRNERSGPLFKVSNDPRITRVGNLLRKTSMDEIPQFVNVLRGQMSLVGPRPALPEEAAVFDDAHGARFSIQPGVTGLWQVEARSNANFGAYRRLDLHYLQNQTLLLDIEILVATVVQVLVALAVLPLSGFHRGVDSDVIDLTEPARVVDLLERRTERVTIEDRESDVSGL